MAAEDLKFILVSGGVISGVGKGVITSSIGTLIKSRGLSVTAIKIDPYLNIDAGTFSPYEHGEMAHGVPAVQRSGEDLRYCIDYLR